MIIKVVIIVIYYFYWIKLFFCVRNWNYSKGSINFMGECLLYVFLCILDGLEMVCCKMFIYVWCRNGREIW